MEKKSKHIAILTPGFPENEADTTCIPALQIYVKALRETTGYDISVISFHYPNTKTNYNWHGISVYSIGSDSVFLKFLVWKKAYQTLKQIHEQKSISTLHSFWLGECALIGQWFSIKNRIKHITTLMGQDAKKGNLYAKMLPLKKEQFIALSDFQQRVFFENYKIKTEIIPWGICPGSFHHSNEKTIDFIGVGSLISLKNHELFIDVIYKINQKRPIKSILIGDGVLKEKLQEKINSLQLENVITLKGKLDYEETLKYISKSKILLHTSNYESFGLVFAEALQSKTMIVSRKIGCFFPSANWAIANTETEIMVSCKNLLSKSFSEKEKNPFTIEKTVQHYLAIYNG